MGARAPEILKWRWKMIFSIFLGIFSVLHVISNRNLLGALAGAFLGVFIFMLAEITVLRNRESKVVDIMTIIFASFFLGSFVLLPAPGYYVVERDGSFFIKRSGFVRPFYMVNYMPEKIEINRSVVVHKKNAEVEYEVKLRGKLNASKEDVLNALVNYGGYKKWFDKVGKDVDSLAVEILKSLPQIPVEVKAEEKFDIETMEMRISDIKLGSVYQLHKLEARLRAVRPVS
jgi:hypothetical protein